MLWGMLWIFGVYGAAIAILHLVYAAHKRRHQVKSVTTFALITHNNETQLEWYLRSLIFISWLRGRRIAIALFDEGSTDTTVEIARKIANEQSHVEVRLMDVSLEAYLADHPDDPIVLHRVKGLGNGEGLSVLQW